MENLQTKSEKQYYIPMEVNETSKEFFIANGFDLSTDAVWTKIGHRTVRAIMIPATKEQYLEYIAYIVERIAPGIRVFIQIVPQDVHLSENQSKGMRCGDNGIFKGMPLTEEQKALSKIAREIYTSYPYDGKYILDEARLIICQSNAKTTDLKNTYPNAEINPLGDWTGGIDVDSGATNRKLGSDMADSVTGGGLHGKDLSKADVSVNIYAFLKAQKTGKPVEICCAIRDDRIDSRPYAEIVEIAREYIQSIGGFEKFAEWGLF